MPGPRLHTPGPWVAWTWAPAPGGYITQAGVDTQDRIAGIAEMCFLSIEFEDRDRFNELVKADTELIGLAPTMLDMIEEAVGYLRTHPDPRARELRVRMLNLADRFHGPDPAE